MRFLSEPFGTTGGGEFRWQEVTPTSAWANGVAPVTTDALPTFTSFCVEYNEEIQFGQTYRATLTDAAQGGGQGGGVGGYDPLDARTAYLITAFSAGTLASYNFDTTGVNAAGLSRVDTANALQLAIWWIEEEWTFTDSVPGVTAAERVLAHTFYTAASTAVTTGAWSGLGNVRVMHLVTDSDGPAQDQVVLVSSPAAIGAASVVPLPPAVAGGVALIGLLWMRRGRSQAT